MTVGITQQYTELDGSHDSDEPVPNRHLVSLRWYRVLFNLNYPLGGGWDVGLSIPFDRKSQKVDFETPDGLPYENPVGNRHHRGETLTGVSDMTVMLNRRGRGAFLPGDEWRLGAGLSLPVGRTEEDPLKRGDAGIRHRHLQFGSGTFDPVLAGGYTVGQGSCFLDGSASFQSALYESAERYRAAPVGTLSLGPRVRVSERIDAGLYWVGTHQWRARWDSRRDPNSGYFQQAVQATLPVRLGSSVAVIPMVQRTMSVDTRGGGDTFEMDWLYALTASFTF